MPDRPTEKEVQEWLETISKHGGLTNAINRTYNTDILFSPDYNKHHTDNFSIDYLFRKRTVIAAQHVLGALKDTSTLFATENISKTRGEKLLPDLILFNSSSNTIIIIEIKRSKKTERETITELYAYEHELRNHLPFIANASLCFVVVSIDFSTLLDHALANMVVWEKKEVLALQLNYSKPEWKLDIHLPDTWEDLRHDGLPPNSIITTNLHLDKTSTPQHAPAVDLKRYITETKKQIVSATQSIARDAENTRSSGFAIAWLDLTDPKSDGGITIGVVDPFILLQQTTHSPTNPDKTPISNIPHPSTDDDTAKLTNIRSLTRTAESILKPHGNIRFSNSMPWPARHKTLRGRSLPVEIEFWGALGDHVRDYISNPTVRKRLIPELDAHGLTWKDPPIGIPLLHQTTRSTIFTCGNIGATGLFQLGELFGFYTLFCRNLDALSKKERLVARSSLTWLGFELTAALREIIFRYTTATNIDTPPPQICLSIDADSKSSTNSINEFVKWMLNSFIGKEQAAHQYIFDAAFRLQSFWNPALRPVLPPAQAAHTQKEAADFISTLLTAIFQATKADYEEIRALHMGAIRNYLSLNDSATEDEIIEKIHSADSDGLAKLGRECIPKMVDDVFGPLSHELKTTSNLLADWDWIRQQVLKLTTEGEKGVAVVIAPDGSIGIRQSPSLAELFTSLAVDYEVSVPIFDDLSGYGVMKIFTWTELKSGAAKF